MSSQNISQHPFVRAMVPEHRSVLLQGAEEKTFSEGEILFREGQPANQLYLLHEGKAALETHVPGKGDVLIAGLGPGQVLGWSWLVPPFVWHFQGRALEPVRVTVLNGGQLLVASERNHYLGYELMKGISKVILEVLIIAHQRWLQTGHHPVIPSEHPTGTMVDMSQPIAERIVNHPFFHGMQPQYRETIIQLASVKEFEAGELMFRIGTPAEGLYIIERGRLLIEAPAPHEPMSVQMIQAGDALGWSSFCEPYEWHFNVRALDATAAVFFKASDLRERCAGDYHFAYDLTKRIARMMLQHLQSTRLRMWQAYR